VSGKALKHIIDNKDKSLFSKLIKILSKKTKIYFSMTSEDKSFIIDYYRNLSDKKICMVGYSISDIDSMMTAHVGISLKKPTNKNMILCNFYISSKNLIDIKAIIAHGKVTFENTFLLLISSILCVCIIDNYMALSFYILMNIKPDHLRIFNCIFYFLSLFGFTNSGDRNIDNSLMKKNIIFWKYIIIQLIGILLIKVFDSVLFFFLYRKNDDIEENKRNEIFITYYSILSYNKIFSTLFSFNFIRFYRRSILENYIFFFLLLLFFYTILSIICVNRSGYSNSLMKSLVFENSQKNSDTFDDRNKIFTLVIMVFDLFCSIIFVFISQYFYNKNLDTNSNEIIKEKKE
jgi:magnesium-transporting ATPase (P-type)